MTRLTFVFIDRHAKSLLFKVLHIKTYRRKSQIMRTTKLWLATLKEAPADAELISHKLMLRAGLIRKLSSGLYTWLPIGLRVLKKVKNIIREEMNRIGAQEILMPAVQPAELWQETG